MYPDSDFLKHKKIYISELMRFDIFIFNLEMQDHRKLELRGEGKIPTILFLLEMRRKKKI